MMAAQRELLAESKQRRQVEVHRHAVDKNQRQVRWFFRRCEERAVQPFVVRGFKRADLGWVVHKELQRFYDTGAGSCQGD
jgi:hypothetical protein